MENVMLVLTVGALCIACFFIGAKTGQTVSKGKDIELPNLDPFKAYRAHQERKEAARERDREAIILENIETYDGTSNGQKEVPR